MDNDLEKKEKRKAIVAFLAYQCEVHADRKVSENMIKAYEMVFMEYDLATLTEAFSKVMTTETYFPTPAHVINAMKKKKADKVEDNSAWAWDTVLSTVSSVGMYGTPRFSDQAIHAAIHSIGGWQRICQSQKKELHWLKAQFVEAYKSAVRRGIQGLQSEKSMQGIHAGEPGQTVSKILCGYLDERSQAENPKRLAGSGNE